MLPLLLLPGMMCDARLYAPQIAAFSHRLPIHYAPLSNHDNVQDLAATVLAHAPAKFALAGLSMGGIVAMEVFAQAPERVGKLALLDTNPKAELDEVKSRRQPQIERVQNGELLPLMQNDMIPNYFRRDETPNTEIVTICEAMAATCGAEVFIRQSLALRERPDQQQTLKNVDVPTLILCGDGDLLCPLERHTLMHDLIPHSRLEVIKNAGHLTTLQQPEAVNAALARWLFD